MLIPEWRELQLHAVITGALQHAVRDHGESLAGSNLWSASKRVTAAVCGFISRAGKPTGDVHVKLAMAERALAYLADRIQTDPDVAYYMGWGTESFRQIAVALSALTDKPLGEVEDALREDRQPPYRRRRAEVLELRDRIAALEERV